jgi:hypothetical protein
MSLTEKLRANHFPSERRGAYHTKNSVDSENLRTTEKLAAENSQLKKLAQSVANNSSLHRVAHH